MKPQDYTPMDEINGEIRWSYYTQRVDSEKGTQKNYRMKPFLRCPNCGKYKVRRYGSVRIKNKTSFWEYLKGQKHEEIISCQIWDNCKHCKFKSEEEDMEKIWAAEHLVNS